MGGPISSEKVEVSLKACSRYKSMGPDGWTMEFYFHFLDLLGGDLVLSIENSWVSSIILSSLNHTYITMFPKWIVLYHFRSFVLLICVTCYIK